MATPSEHTTDSETLTSLPEDIDSPINELDPKPSTEANGEKRKRDETEEEENGEPKKALHPLWKTSLCSFFRSQSGVCSHGETCRFAHSEDELQPRPDNSWDPTSQRAKKLLKAENGEKVEKVEVPDAREDVLMTDELGDSSDPALNKCLVPLPKNWTSDSLKNFLNQKGILYKSAKKKKGMTVGFVSFETQDQLNKAFEGLDGNTLPNHKTIKLADVRPRSFEKKTTNSSDKSAKPPMETESTCEDPTVSLSLEGQENGETDDPNVDNSSSKVRTARDAVTPLAHMPYSSQLEHKKNSLAQALKRLTRSARKACPDGISLPEWILKSREIGGLPCKLEGIIESPLVNGYRNKCEFSVGYSLQGTPTVGFMLGNFREGVTAVEEPTDCPNVSKVACRFASIFQEFLQHSGLPLWNRLNNTGFWRQLTVREGRKPDQVVGVENLEANISEVLLMVQVCSTGVDDELIKSEYQRLAHAFVQGATAIFPHLPLTSLVVQDHKGVSNVAPADAPLLPLPIPKAENASGEPANGIVETRIHDYISNLRFSISPTAFFQVNTLAAEKLYSLAGDWAGLGPDTLLFDICCGTGTIGLTLAHRVGMVVGIEMNASAVSDAHKNAENNGVKNCKFVCAKAEDVMGSLLKEYLDVPDKQEETPHASENNGKGVNGDKGNNTLNDKQNSSEEKKETVEFPQKQYKDVVAIVDPPRVGLHHVVIKALRTHPRLRRLVYISCNPESLVANAIELCTPSSDKVEKGKKDNWGWKNTTAASLARRRTKSMPNSEPFRPVRAIAVDLFPHTPHCEMVMLLERSQVYCWPARLRSIPQIFALLGLTSIGSGSDHVTYRLNRALLFGSSLLDPASVGLVLSDFGQIGRAFRLVLLC